MSGDPSDGQARLKVLHVGKYFPPYRGGMETYLRDLMIALKPLGVDCSALVHRSEISLTSTEEHYQDEGETVAVTRAAVWFRAIFTPFSPTFPLLLRKLIKRDQPDILHLHMPNVSAFWALFLPSAREIPWVVHWHSDVLPSSHSLGLRLFYRMYKPFETAVLKRAARVIATSPPYLESSEPLRPFREKCEVVPLGIRPPKSSPEAQVEPRNPEEPLRVLSVGRLSYYKGFKYLIEALADVPNATLRIVGEGEERPDLERLIADLALGDRVTLVGAVSNEDLDKEYRDCDVFCLPSIERTEAFGLVLLEAMAWRKVAVTTSIQGSGAPWITGSGQLYNSIQPMRVDMLEECLRRFAENRDNIEILVNHQFRTFERTISIATSATRIHDELYKIQSREPRL